MARYCLDASFVLGRLIFPSTSPAILARWNSITDRDELLAPHLLFAECTSVLTRYVYDKQVDESRARALVQVVVQLPVRLVHMTSLYQRAFAIARSLGWKKAYDALYLATAEHEDAELITVDGGMNDAARRLSIRASLVQ
jgi:predicted nucleic acid-binding protein